MVLKQYIFWHYNDALKTILKAWNNILSFIFYYFSISLLFKTFFSYWKRSSSSYSKEIGLKKNLENFIINLMSRTLGAVIRFFLIIIGLIFSFSIFITGLIIFLLWITLPIWLFYVFNHGLKLT